MLSTDQTIDVIRDLLLTAPHGPFYLLVIGPLEYDPSIQIMIRDKDRRLIYRRSYFLGQSDIHDTHRRPMKEFLQEMMNLSLAKLLDLKEWQLQNYPNLDAEKA